MPVAYVSLGSNQGDPPANLAAALVELTRLPGVGLSRASAVYLTEPQDRKNQPWFANQVVALDCAPEMTPDGLLDGMLAIEARFGRSRGAGEERFGPRPLDLDLLLFGPVERSEARLILPHPRLHRRAFVLVPLREIAPDLRLPDGRSVSELLGKIRFRVDGNLIHQA